MHCRRVPNESAIEPVIVHRAAKFDVSAPLATLRGNDSKAYDVDCKGAACGTSPGNPDEDADADPDADQDQQQKPEEPVPPTVITPEGAAVEQTSQGTRAPIPLVESFDGLGEGFVGPQGTGMFRSPSDSSLAVGPDHIFQIVNSRIAVYSKRGKKYDKTGTVFTERCRRNAIFKGFGGVCDARNSGDAVVRYDQLADRWLVVMPMFSRIGPGEFPESTSCLRRTRSRPANLQSPVRVLIRAPQPRFRPNPPPPPPYERGQRPPEKTEGVWAMCYAVSTGPDPLGTYYRYAFERTLFPDYPRPADLARWLLPSHQHGRYRDSKARLHRRSRRRCSLGNPPPSSASSSTA